MKTWFRHKQQPDRGWGSRILHCTVRILWLRRTGSTVFFCVFFFLINVFEFDILGNFVTDFLGHKSDHLADVDRAPSLIVPADCNWGDVIPQKEAGIL